MRPGRRWLAGSAIVALVAALVVVSDPPLVPGGDGPAAAAADTDIGVACPTRDIPATAPEDATGTHGDAMRCLVWYGISEGRTATEFGARDDMERGQLASLLVRMLDLADVDLPEPAEPRFDDLSGNQHAGAIERLAEADVFQGTDPGIADARADITREQFASLVVRTVEHVEQDTFPQADDAFEDVGGTHADAVDVAAAVGFVEGVEGARFEPRATLSREQGASMVARVLDRFVGNDRLAPPPAGGFEWDAAPIPSEQRDAMVGVSWEEGCPVPIDDLRLVELSHRGFDDRIHRGELVVHHTVVDDLREVFSVMFDHDLPLERVEPIEAYDGDDDASMAANNTHAFNCRQITGGTTFSEHSYGTAIDLNPIQNPYERDGEVLPPEGSPYLDRSDVREGMFVEGDPVVQRFDSLGWEWGGRWDSLVDHMHFERPR